MTDPGGSADARAASVEEDEPVLRYLQAVEAGRAAPPDFPQPEGAGPALAGADMVTGDDRDGLEVQLAESTPGTGANMASLEAGFVRAAPGYARRHGITYEGWRAAGVDAEVLARAGIAATGE